MGNKDIFEEVIKVVEDESISKNDTLSKIKVMLDGFITVNPPDIKVNNQRIPPLHEKLNYDTTYKVYYKLPHTTYEESKIKSFIGYIENFVPSGLNAFINNDGEMLHVYYRDIIQMSPLKKQEPKG